MIGHNCHICGHGETYHDQWGICAIQDCKLCYTELECPRCHHTFFDHSIWVDRTKVMCVHQGCKLLVCYDIKHPERPSSMYSTGFEHHVTQLVPRRVQPTYEESLAPHPLTTPMAATTPLTVVPDAEGVLRLVKEAVAVVDDPLVAPGIWKQYRPGRSYDTAKQGYTVTDLEEKNDNGSYKHHQPGRTWETRLSGYVEDVPIGPPERGFLD